MTVHDRMKVRRLYLVTLVNFRDGCSAWRYLSLFRRFCFQQLLHGFQKCKGLVMGELLADRRLISWLIVPPLAAAITIPGFRQIIKQAERVVA